MVLALLVDRGLLDYEARVAALWPAFGAHGKDSVTVGADAGASGRRAGISEQIDPDLWLDPPACAAAIAALAPLWPPGRRSGYHPLTWGYIAGELAQRAGGRSLGTVLREDICEPLGLDFRIGTPESEHVRCAEMKKPTRAGEFGEITPPRKAAFFTPWAAPVRGSAQWRRIEIPSANGHGTALAVARLYEAYATGGDDRGQPGDLARNVRCADAAALDRRRSSAAVQYRLAHRDHRQFQPRLWAQCGGVRAFRNAGGSVGFGDPVAGVSAGYVMNKQSHYIMGDPRSLKLIDALYSCL